MENESKPIITKHFIDLDKVIASKSERLAKALPGFVLRYLKNIIHQEEINSFLYEHRNKFGLNFIDEIVRYFDLNIPVTGIENLPERGRYTIVSNHPLGGLDGMALMHIIGQKRQDFVFPVNDLLLFIPNVKEFFIPINKHGKNTENIRRFDETFASDKLILYFPAGLVSRKKKGIIRDPEWKKTFLTKARKFNRDIIPVYIGGRNSNFFYNLANIRTALGIKSNIEMLYLPNEMFKQTDNTIPITFGKPIPISYFNRKLKKDIEWAEDIKKQVYALGNKEPLPISI
ncbi:MAG: 1-acyl-sn-glycerol-3-phosphate acyltransferase [Bacteroidales bacterium]|nr:1-acyl-sn-glycerol-3-phosphate acyltransferase [Bacteroidales bacterium]